MSRALKSAAVIAAGAVPLVAASGAGGYASAGTVLHGQTGQAVAGTHPDLSCGGPQHPIGHFMNAHSGKLTEVFHSSTADGATVDQWSNNDTKTQFWCSYSVGPGEVEIVNDNSGKCLEVFHSATNNGARVDQWGCNNTATQHWSIRQVGKTSFSYVNAHSGKCLEVFHSATNNGARVDQWTCNGTPTQVWSP